MQSESSAFYITHITCLLLDTAFWAPLFLLVDHQQKRQRRQTGKEVLVYLVTPRQLFFAAFAVNFDLLYRGVVVVVDQRARQ